MLDIGTRGEAGGRLFSLHGRLDEALGALQSIDLLLFSTEEKSRNFKCGGKP